MASNQARGRVLSMVSVDCKPQTIFKLPVHTFLVIFFRRDITVFNQHLHTEIYIPYSYIFYRDPSSLTNMSSFRICPSPLLKRRAVPPPTDINDPSYAMYPSQPPSEVDAPPYDLIETNLHLLSHCHTPRCSSKRCLAFRGPSAKNQSPS